MKRCQLDWYRVDVRRKRAEARANRPPKPRVPCDECGEVYEQRNRRQRFCSNKCKTRVANRRACEKRARKKIATRECPWCYVNNAESYWTDKKPCHACEQQIYRNGRCDQCDGPQRALQSGYASSSELYCPRCDEDWCRVRGLVPIILLRGDRERCIWRTLNWCWKNVDRRRSFRDAPISRPTLIFEATLKQWRSWR